MIYSNETLAEIQQKKQLYNPQYAKWYFKMFNEFGGKTKEVIVNEKKKIVADSEFTSIKLFNRGEAINNCLNLWLWDKYEKNKILDLQKVNRCKNRAFCPNCKKLNVARFIHEFRQIMPELLDKYDFYMLTLTVPSCIDDGDGKELSKIINRLNDKFRILNRRLSTPKLTPTGKLSKHAFQDRYFDMSGGIRVLEITHNNKAGFHPHFHCVVLVPKNSIDLYLLEECEKGKYSRNSKSYKYWNEVELQLGKLWTMLWYDLSLQNWSKFQFYAKEKYLKMNHEDTEYLNLQIDFRPLDDKGIFEVFKYTFKDSDVSSYKVFKSLVFALDNKRFRQGFGVLYNFKCEEFDEGEVQPLDLAEPEEPSRLLTTEINQLITEFKDYKKISRFNKGNLDEVYKSITE